MATEPGADGAEVIAFRDAAAFEAWLTDHVDHTPGVWLKLAKKSSGVASLTDDEAVDVGLCFGWISGQRRSLDETYYLQKYVPRRPRSRWSQVNVRKVAELDGRRSDAPLRHRRGRGCEGRRPLGRCLRVAEGRHHATRPGGGPGRRTPRPHGRSRRAGRVVSTP